MPARTQLADADRRAVSPYMDFIAVRERRTLGASSSVDIRCAMARRFPDQWSENLVNLVNSAPACRRRQSLSGAGTQDTLRPSTARLVILVGHRGWELVLNNVYTKSGLV